jgi:hypothetical protein
MATKKEESTALTTITNAGALANIDFGDHAGAGTKNMTGADQAIPFLSLLQALSKVISDPSQKVKGAEAGMIMDSVSKQLYDGTEGVTFLPCNTARVYVAWKGEPGSGSVAGRYAPNDPLVKTAGRKFAFNEMKDPDGNRLVETFYVIGMVLGDDMVPTGMGIISFTSTKIKAYKESIGVLRTLPGNAPLYAFPLRLTSRPETRPKGTSYNFVIKPLGYDGNVFKDGVPASVILPASEAGQMLYPLAKALADDFDNGAANIAYDTEGSHGGDGADSENEPY